MKGDDRESLKEIIIREKILKKRRIKYA